MYEERVIRPKNQLKLGLGNSGLQHTSEMNYVSSGGRSVPTPICKLAIYNFSNKTLPAVLIVCVCLYYAAQQNKTKDISFHCNGVSFVT